VVVDEGEEEAAATGSRGSDRPAQIRVHQLEGFIRLVLSLLWERSSSLLPCQAGLAQLIGGLDVGESTDHTAARHLLECLEVQVTVPCMPASVVGVVAYAQTHGTDTR
jgi:hypothetical protein